MRAAFFFALAAFALRAVSSPVVIEPATAPTVTAPLTTPTAASGQQLLGQINASLSQRRATHDIVTSNARRTLQTPVFISPPLVVRVGK